MHAFRQCTAVRRRTNRVAWLEMITLPSVLVGRGSIGRSCPIPMMRLTVDVDISTVRK